MAFSEAPDARRARPTPLATTHLISAACASPNAVTFALELRCQPHDADKRGEFLLVGNSSAHGYTPDVLRAIMQLPEARNRFAGQAAALARAGGFGGLLLDFRLLGTRDVSGLVSLVEAIGDSARAHGVAPVGIVIPVADTAAYPGRHLGALTDFLALRLELEPAVPGPMTPRDRMAAFVGARAGEIGAHRLMLLIPADGYVWAEGSPRTRVSFEEAVATARDWGVELVRDESSATLRANAPRRGTIWVNDAVLIAEIVRDARRLGIRKFGLYGLGGEDPAISTVIAASPPVRR